MSISVMKQALDAITNVLAGGDFDNPYADLKEAALALQQAIAEVEKQEDLARVGEVGVWGDKREWVGLTDEEIDTWNIVGHESLRDFVRAIEAKLKEKNYG